MMIPELLAALVGKLAGLGTAAKALGLTIASGVTAGAVAILPGPAENAVKPPVAPDVEIPVDLPAGADFGLGVAADATGGEAASGGADFGLDTARETPAGDHVPAFVPGPPAGRGPRS